MDIVDRDEMTVAGVLVHADWRRLWDEAPKAWRRLFQRAAELDAMQSGPFVDISLGIVDSAYLQLVGVSLQAGTPVPDGLGAVRIPAQQYLHHLHTGPVSRIADSFGEMYAWAGQRGLKPGEFKLDFGYRPRGDETEHELFIALTPETDWHFVTADRSAPVPQT